MAKSLIIAGTVVVLMHNAFVAAEVNGSTLLGSAGKAGTPRYDGRWWLSIPPSEQEGVIAGYIDCYMYEYGGPDHYNARSFGEYMRLITEGYRNEPAKQSMPISEIIHDFRDEAGAKTAPSNALPRHGHLDGLYWKQMGGQDRSEQVGFVEGYLWCHSELAQNMGGVFSKRPVEYADLITQWYRSTEEAGLIEEKAIKIADVLFRVR